MQRRLTDQAVVAVAVARAIAAPNAATVAHLLAGLVTEPEGRAGRRLRERGSAAAALVERVAAAPAPPLHQAVDAAVTTAGARAATTVDLLDAAITAGGADVADLLEAVGYQRDLDGWLTSDPAREWFEDAETHGFNPGGNDILDPAASRVVAQVRAVNGGAVDILIAAAAAPESPLEERDPRTLAATADRLRSDRQVWDAGLPAVVAAAATWCDGRAVTLRDLVQAAMVAGGDGPRLVLEFSS